MITLLQDLSDVDAYVDHYLSFFGEEASLARVNPGVYVPMSCIVFRPPELLISQLRELAAEVGECLLKLFRSYHDGVFLTASDSVSGRVPRAHRSPHPTLIRLDVIETDEGCKVLEVNAGNCAGIEIWARMYSFLRDRLFPSAPKVPRTLSYLIDVITGAPNHRAVCAFIDSSQCRYLGIARRGLVHRIDPSIRIDVCHIADVMYKWGDTAAAEFLFRDFMYEEIDLATPFGRAVEELLLSLPPNRHFPSLSDEFLSDKSYIANVDELVRDGLAADVGLQQANARAWSRWMAPTARLTDAVARTPDAGFNATNGLVLKPSAGYGGEGIHVVDHLERETLSLLGSRSHIVQRFYRTPRHLLRRSNGTREFVHLVHGVFLIPDAHTLVYGGTFTRLSPNPIIGRNGDIALFCEPEWFLKSGAVHADHKFEQML